MKTNYILLEPSDVSDIKDGLKLLAARVDALHDEAHHKNVRKQAEETLLTLPETCAYLRIGKATAFRWIRQGTLTPVKAGRKNLFAMVDLEKVLTRVNNRAVRGYDYK